MRRRFLVLMCAVAATVVVSLAPALVAGQSAAGTLRTSWGDPNLQGVWVGTTKTPLERPLVGAKVAEGTVEEAEQFAKEEERLSSDPTQRAKELAAGNSGAYSEAWQNTGRFVKGRASLIVDPPDGRLPMTPEAVARNAGRSLEDADSDRTSGPGSGGGLPKGKGDNPEDRNLAERCHHYERFITGGPSQAYRIVQVPGYVAISTERLHENRVIPLDGRPHLPQDVRLWKGDSRGRWEGATLVVDTTNFIHAPLDRLGANGNLLHVIERYTRVDANTINYEATLEDPTTWTRPWTLALPLWKQPEGTIGIYEYACHEGNALNGGGMLGILLGARVQEKEAGAKQLQ